MDMYDDSQLMKLSETKLFEVAGDSHDIRGWQVVDERGLVLGTVNDLLFDRDSDEVRYAVVDTPTKQVLVPIGSLGFEDHARRVVAQGLTADRMRDLTPFQAAMPLTLAAERTHYEESIPGVQRDALDYSAAPFRATHPPIQRMEERMREDRVHALDLRNPLAQRELSFAASEPSDDELIQRDHILRDMPINRDERFNRREIDFGLDRPR